MMQKVVSIIIVLFLLTSSIGFLFDNVSSSEKEFQTGSRVGPTYISGFILNNTTWTKEKSPYIIIANTTLTQENTLTINAGTVVKFSNNTWLSIKGMLNVNGEASTRVVFTANGTFYKLHGGDVKIQYNCTGVNYNIVISTESGGVADISFAIFEHSTSYALKIGSAEGINNNKISNCIFRYNRDGIGGLIGKNMVIKNSSFENNCHGIHNSECSVINSKFQNNTYALRNSQVIVISSRFYNNTFVGVSISNSEFRYCELFNNDIGLDLRSNVEINKCSVYNNNVGIYCSEIEDGVVHYNNIYNNTEYNLITSFQDDLNIKNNWWGTTNTSTIEEYILDFYDDTRYGEGIYYPFLSGPIDSTNKPPIADAGPDRSFIVNKTAFFQLNNTYDPNNDPLIYAWNFGDGNYLETEYNFNTHVYENIGNYTLTITVTDGEFLASDTSLVFIINGPDQSNNSKPVFKSYPSLSATVGIKWIYSIIVTDEDMNDTVSIELIACPDGMIYENNSLNWTPTEAQKGKHNVKIMATDGKVQVYQEFQLKVKKNDTSPKVMSSNIVNNSVIPVITKDILINFSAPMNRSSVESSLNINPEVNYTTYWRKNDTQLLIRIDELILDTTYKIAIDARALDENKNNMGAGYELIFTTEEAATSSLNDSEGDFQLVGFELAIIILIMITLIITLGFIFKNRKKGKIEYDGERIAMDGRTEFDETDIDKISLKKVDPDDDTNKIIMDLESNALSRKKSSDFNLSKENMLKNAKRMLENGEISRETYQSIEERLLK